MLPLFLLSEGRKTRVSSGRCQQCRAAPWVVLLSLRSHSGRLVEANSRPEQQTAGGQRKLFQTFVPTAHSQLQRKSRCILVYHATHLPQTQSFEWVYHLQQSSVECSHNSQFFHTSYSKQARKQMFQLRSTDVTQRTAIMRVDGWMNSLVVRTKYSYFSLKI